MVDIIVITAITDEYSSPAADQQLAGWYWGNMVNMKFTSTEPDSVNLIHKQCCQKYVMCTSLDLHWTADLEYVGRAVSDDGSMVTTFNTITRKKVML